MGAEREDLEEIVRICPFTLDGIDMLDIRFWKATKAGPRPTKRGIAIKACMSVKMIVAIQRIMAKNSSDQARLETAIRE